MKGKIDGKLGHGSGQILEKQFLKKIKKKTKSVVESERKGGLLKAEMPRRARKGRLYSL